MANRNWMNGHKVYTNLTAPSIVTCQFTVDADDTAGNGITNLISNGYVKNVFMHTSATPSAGNPNPGSGYILVQLTDNYAKALNSFAAFTSPLTGSDLSTKAADAALTVGQAYQITVLGSATSANWTTMGVPAGVTPAVGVTFIAKATGAGTSSTSKVQAFSVSAISHVETLTDNSSDLAPQGTTNQGGWIMLKCLAPTINTTHFDTPYIPTAPAEGTKFSISFLLDNSSVTVDGL